MIGEEHLFKCSLFNSDVSFFPDLEMKEKMATVLMEMNLRKMPQLNY